MSALKRRLAFFVLATVVFTIIGTVFCLAAWLGIRFIQWRDLGGLPWGGLRLTFVLAVGAAFCAACSDEALD